MKQFLRRLVWIFVVQEQLNMILRFCTVSYGGLHASETVSTGSFDACAVRYEFTLFLLYPNSCWALATAQSAATACFTAALPSRHRRLAPTNINLLPQNLSSIVVANTTISARTSTPLPPSVYVPTSVHILQSRLNIDVLLPT